MKIYYWLTIVCVVCLVVIDSVKNDNSAKGNILLKFESMNLFVMVYCELPRYSLSFPINKSTIVFGSDTIKHI